MIELKNNHRHRQRSCIETCRARKNFTSLLASANLKQWIIILFLFYKLDYKDYYCYGISSSSSSAILNNENGKVLVCSSFFASESPMKYFSVLLHFSLSLESQFVILPNFLLPIRPEAGALCSLPSSLLVVSYLRIFFIFYLVSCLSWER